MMTANGVGNFFLLVFLFLITARDRHEGVSFFFKTTTITHHFLRKQNLVWAQKLVWNKCAEACDGSPSPRRTLAAGCHHITKFHF